MRIAVVNWTSRKAGGIESYLHNLLPGLARRGHDLALWHEMDVPADRDRVFLPEGAPSWCVADLGSAGALRALHDWRPDVLFTHGLLDPALEAKTLAIGPAVFFAHAYYGTCISGNKTFGRPVVTPCHRQFGPGCLVRYFPCRCGGLNPMTMWREYRRQSARLGLLRRYRSLLTYSCHMRDEYIRHSFAPESITALPYYSTSLPLPLAEVTAHPPKGRLLFLGRMDPLKGGQVLLQALPAAAKALGRTLHLTLAGDGPSRANWQQDAARLEARCPDVRTEFAGWVTGDRLEALWQSADLAVVPSLWPEPFGLIGLEAARRAVPVAAFAVGGIPEWLTDGVNGHLAGGDPPTAPGLAEAIVKCLRDPEAHARLCRGALAVARRYDADRHLDLLLDVLRKAMSATTASRG